MGANNLDKYLFVVYQPKPLFSFISKNLVKQHTPLTFKKVQPNFVNSSSYLRHIELICILVENSDLFCVIWENIKLWPEYIVLCGVCLTKYVTEQHIHWEHHYTEHPQMARNLTWDEDSAQLTSHDISRSVLDPL